MEIDEDFYTLTQINSLEFKYDVSFFDQYIDDWLVENLEEGEDFNFGETIFGTHACTVNIKFLNESSAAAFKLRWT